MGIQKAKVKTRKHRKSLKGGAQFDPNTPIPSAIPSAIPISNAMYANQITLANATYANATPNDNAFLSVEGQEDTDGFTRWSWGWGRYSPYADKKILDIMKKNLTNF
jgi:hypothetical protein